MRMFLRHLAIITVVALSPMAIVTLATPAVSSADCGGRGWDPVAKLCVPPPSLPDWYRAAPTWAQSWAPAWASPPPPAPPWAEAMRLQPVWDPIANTWTWIYIR